MALKGEDSHPCDGVRQAWGFISRGWGVGSGCWGWDVCVGVGWPRIRRQRGSPLLRTSPGWAVVQTRNGFFRLGKSLRGIPFASGPVWAGPPAGGEGGRLVGGGRGARRTSRSPRRDAARSLGVSMRGRLGPTAPGVARRRSAQSVPHTRPPQSTRTHHHPWDRKVPLQRLLEPSHPIPNRNNRPPRRGPEQRGTLRSHGCTQQTPQTQPQHQPPQHPNMPSANTPTPIQQHEPKLRGLRFHGCGCSDQERVFSAREVAAGDPLCLRTRVGRAPRGWGRGAACRWGAGRTAN